MSVSIITKAKKRPVAAALCGALAIILGYFLLWPVPFDPVTGPPRAANPAGSGIYVKNNRLAEAKMAETGVGPEAVAFDKNGRLYTGLTNGDIIRSNADGKFEVLANTGGRPLGLKFDAAGNLIIADAHAGLLSMTPAGAISVLATDHQGARMIFVDDLAVAADGKIYFSDASMRYSYGNDILEVFEFVPTGRLMVYDPRDKSVKVLLDQLYFANGITLSADEDFVLVNETYGHRIMRYWLKGAKTGQSDIFADNLPAYIDNVTTAPDGGFWVAGVAARTEQLDALVTQPFMRKVIWRLMQLTGADPAEHHSYAIKLSADGQPLISLEDDSGHIYMMTSVIERGGKLYLGSLLNDAVGIIDAP